MKTHPFFCAGEWLESPQKQAIINPYTGKPVHEVCLAGPAALQKAVAGAERGFGLMRALPAHKRAAILDKAAELLTARQAAIAQTITQETGKPITDAETEVVRSAGTFRFAAQEALRLTGEVVPMDTLPIGEGRIAFTQRHPVGPVLAITPFNFPVNLSAHKIAPAIAAGNSVVLKPPPQAPASCLALATVLLEAGMPPEALSILPCSNQDAESLVRDDRLKMLSFTGSAAVGWKLKSLAGKKKILLELGGNAGVIVDRDADLDWAVQRCLRGAFVHAGQTCISVQRIYVHQQVFPAFTDTFVAGVRQLKMGDPMNPETFVGPMIDKSAVDKAEAIVQDAVQQGAKVLTGGKRKDPFFEPTVLAQVPAKCKAICEEAFAPLAVLQPFSDFGKVLADINAGPYGLQAGVFTRDIDKAMQAAAVIEAGAVLINDIPTYRVDNMPYGGIKDSGFGREGLRYAMEAMTEPKLIIVNTKRN